MAFDPERDGWRLDEAIMRLSDPEALARLARACRVAEERDHQPRLPRWWLKDIAPAPAGKEPNASLNQVIGGLYGAIEQAFVDGLTGGEVVGWARYDSPVALYQPIPADAWPILSASLYRWEWHDGTIRVEEVRSREVFQPVPEPAPWWRDGQKNPRPRFRGSSGRRLETERHVVLRLYSVRIQPPDRFRQIGKSASEAQCRAWLAELMKSHPARPRSKASLMQEARPRFGIGAEAFKRAWSAAVRDTGSTWGKAGRRKSSG